MGGGLGGWVLSVERVKMYMKGAFCGENMQNYYYFVEGCCFVTFYWQQLKSFLRHIP
jgi:hypothetical protein